MHPDFNPPGRPPKLTGRKSTLTGLFFTTLTPYIEPSKDEVSAALSVLGMVEGRCVCAYCGDKKTEWDHFHPIVVDRKPTGYITEIANLVPSCSKCNQSKGNKNWKTWMLGTAKQAPKRRAIPDLQKRIELLEAYENWKVPIRIDYQGLFGPADWRKHLMFLDDVLDLLVKAEENALLLRKLAAASIGEKVS